MKQKQFNILIVDDEANNILLLQNIFESENYFTFGVKKGLDALKATETKRFDCILLDIMMPGMDGFEVCKQLKANKKTKNIPVIFITAGFDIGRLASAFEYGAVDYITKPFHAEEVIARVKTHLRLRHSQLRLKKELKHSKKIQLQLEENEKKYRLLFENSMLAIGMAKLNGEIVEKNEAMNQLFGFASDSGDIENVKLTYNDVTDREQVLNELFHKGYVKDKEVELKKKNGEILTCIINSNLIKINNKQLILTALSDITKKKNTEKEIVNAIIETEEKDRRYFAQELHDGLAPILSTTKLFLQSISEAKTADKAKYFWQNATESLDEAIISLKEISNRLSPHVLKNFGLVSALQVFISKIQLSSKIKIEFTSNFNERIDNIVEVTFYRITTELIHNTLKHANASKITIQLVKMTDSLSLNYVDDGIGFDVVNMEQNREGLGLFNLQNRIKSLSGNIEIQSVPEQGVNIYANIPTTKKI